ncbi:MAG TPA: class I SAM-dependent methyltransferase [Streptosporangiaceae bacterium]
MSPITAEIQALKDAHRKTWASGDYARIAELVTEVGERLVERDLHAGLARALAAGGEQLGGEVRGNDLSASAGGGDRGVAGTRGHVQYVRARLHAGEWLTADAEDLPFEDERFDYVLSSLGVQFVPRHEVVSSELVRVCRTGGTIVLGNWAADGYIGRFWTIMGPYLPPPPDYASPPAAWGRSEHVVQLFADYPVDLTSERYALDFEADSAEVFIDTLADYYGPLLQARNKLTPTGRWEALRDELIALSNEMNAAGDGHFRAPSEYLVTLARKPT